MKIIVPVLSMNPSTKLFEELKSKLQETNDVSGIICLIRQAFVIHKQSEQKDPLKITQWYYIVKIWDRLHHSVIKTLLLRNHYYTYMSTNNGGRTLLAEIDLVGTTAVSVFVLWSSNVLLFQFKVHCTSTWLLSKWVECSPECLI